jgi:hypothetical protein
MIFSLLFNYYNLYLIKIKIIFLIKKNIKIIIKLSILEFKKKNIKL